MEERAPEPGGDEVSVANAASKANANDVTLSGAAVSPNIAVADTTDEGPVPDEDENATPAELQKKTPPERDEQLQKAIDVLKNRQG